MKESSGVLVKEELFGELPPEWPDSNLLFKIQQNVKELKRKVVVLDDDPTGSQTVHGIFVRTSWTVEELKNSLGSEEDLFFILTNTRSLPREKAREINAEIANNLCQAASELGCEFTVISRGDSTLRGHFPDEVEVLEEVLGEKGLIFAGQILVPVFLEGGRYTIGDTHFVQDGKFLIPAAETEFARDSVFGYRNSNLGLYIEEKTGGRIAVRDVISIGVSEIRTGGPRLVAQKLARVTGGKTIVVNSASYRDLEVFVLGLLDAEAQGKRFIVRSSASFVKVRGGISSRSLLNHQELSIPGSENLGGLVVVGSYVGKTSSQIEAAIKLPGLRAIEVDVLKILEPTTRDEEIERVSAKVNDLIRQGNDVMVYTSRQLVTHSSKEGNLSVGNKVSASLVKIVQGLEVQPRFLVAKGGITSNDVATSGLGVKAAKVLGQVYPGIPVWLLGQETKFPGMPYVVFPGNVGNKETLVEIIALMRGSIERIG
ncbi:MAG: hydroxyacid dehydrogenase [Clostridia bacterium]|nr:hydroxyacid dehydrogenase [Clostridia bacterium]